MLSMRLSAEQQAVLLRDYEAGIPGRELAERYGAARSAMIQFLRSRGATIRRSRITEQELAQIVTLYSEGVRQIDVAKCLGRTKGAIWHALRRAGEL